MNWHLLPLTEISKLLSTTPAGIDHVTARQRLIEHGKNQITEKKKKSVFQILSRQFMDFMILILIVSAIISGVLGDVIDTIVILAIILLNAIVGFIQEYRAEKAMDALNQMASTTTRVLRESKVTDIPTSDLVPGDVVMLEAGNIIPADIRFIETHQLKIDESTLTGESHNVDKNPGDMPIGDYPLGDITNMGFKGTFITNGRALAYVTTTGMNTELGRIAKMIQTNEAMTPLQRRLSVFGKRLSVIILVLCTLFFIMGWLRGDSILTLLLTSISLAVAAIPEAMPALVTITLALGANRMVKSHALIRKLPAVETLGSVTVICTDKTGTLTLNRITVKEIFETPDNSAVHFLTGNMLLNAMALNNDVSKNSNGTYLGDSTEVALVQYAADNNIDKVHLENKYPRIAELPFDPHRKCMTTFHQTDNGVVAITKGAADTLIDKISEQQKSFIYKFESKINEMAFKGYRVLGFAIRKFPAMPDISNIDEVESSLTLIGFAGMIDPPREEVKKAVEECKLAGIIPIMITGDHKLTAKAIALQLGIISSDNDIALSGPELSNLTQDEFKSIVERVRVYARVNPEQKLKIVSALQDNHQIVAMTGDGVNDAPALKNADIGIAMGINGTEVSKEASHMILLDDNFATIIVAVRHGRRIFDNILKFIKFIMTGNSGELWAIFLAPFFGLPIPLLPIHILWINLVSDGLPGLALASEPAESNIMKRPPRNPKQNIFAGGMAWHILLFGFLIGITTIGIQAWAITNENAHWQTMVFSVLCFIQLGHVMAIRSETQSIFKIGVFSNKPMLLTILISVALQMMIIYIPFFNNIFKTQPLSLYEMIITFLVSSIVFWAVEIGKWTTRVTPDLK